MPHRIGQVVGRWSKRFFIALAALSTIAGCTRTEIIDIPPPIIEPLSGTRIVISDIADLPSPVPFDNISVNLVGTDWQVIGIVRAIYSGGRATLNLPESIPSERLSKAVRDTYNDYEGYWPAEETTDRSARVAGFEGGDIIACNGSVRVGRIYLSDYDVTPPDSASPAADARRHHIYYMYADRPFELSGYNLTSPREDRRSFRYEASFAAGWNAYMNVTFFAASAGATPPPSLCTTEIDSSTTPLRWRFEAF